MGALTENQTDPLQVLVTRCLAEGVDTARLDEFLDRMFELTSQAGRVSCDLLAEKVIQLRSKSGVLLQTEIPLAKAKVRMLCARLAVRCGESAGRKLSPYGDVAEVKGPSGQQHFLIRFENTTHIQAFTIDLVPPTPAVRDALQSHGPQFGMADMQAH